MIERLLLKLDVGFCRIVIVYVLILDELIIVTGITIKNVKMLL